MAKNTVQVATTFVSDECEGERFPLLIAPGILHEWAEICSIPDERILSCEPIERHIAFGCVANFTGIIITEMLPGTCIPIHVGLNTFTIIARDEDGVYYQVIGKSGKIVTVPLVSDDLRANVQYAHARGVSLGFSVQ